MLEHPFKVVRAMGIARYVNFGSFIYFSDSAVNCLKKMSKNPKLATKLKE